MDFWQNIANKINLPREVSAFGWEYFCGRVVREGAIPRRFNFAGEAVYGIEDTYVPSKKKEESKDFVLGK